MQLLATIPLSGHRVVFPPSMEYGAAYDVLSALLTEAEGREVAGFFAMPKRQPDRIEFFVKGGRVARFEELDQIGRDRVRAEIGRLLGVLRRAAQRASERDPARCGAWPDLVRASIEIPSFEYVFACDGRPVLAGWGMVPGNAANGLGLLSVLDDGQLDAPRPRFPLLATSAAAVLLMAIGGLAALLVPFIGLAVSPPEPVCRISEVDRRTLLDMDREKTREQELRRALAAINVAMGQRRAACPIPVIRQPAQAVPPAPLPPISVPPPPVPPAQAPSTVPERSAAPPPTPKVEATGPSRQPVQKPTDAQPCNTETKSGGAGITSTKHFLGNTPGRVRLYYDTLKEPDRIAVYHQGRRIAGTAEDRNRGFVSGTGGFEFDWNPPSGGAPGSYVVTVEVTGTPGSRSTEWRYNIGCPSER